MTEGQQVVGAGDSTPMTAEEVVAATGGEIQYVILEVDEQVFHKAGTASARNAQAAVRSLERAGEFIAVPVRNWTAVTVKTRTETVYEVS